MTIKGRSPAMRHVTRTHRVALDWLFDRINLEPKIQIKYVDTKNQLADTLTKRSFSRDEGNHLLCLFNIMSFSCSHFKSILSQVRERIVIGAMSKRGQNTTSNDGSPTAKARPVKLVMHSPCNEDSSTRFGISGQSVHDCRNDLMVHVSFLEPTNEKVHQQCSRRVCAKTRSGLSDRITNKKRHRPGTQDLSTTKAFTRASKLHTRYFLLLNVVHASFTRGTVERNVVFPSRLPAPSRLASAHCMRVIATVWALTNRLAQTAGSFLIRSCREFSHLPSARLLR